MQRSVYENNPPAGRAWVYDSDMWYSPNSMWFTPPPPHDDKPDVITPGESTAAEYQEPRWWNPATEWMGFVPKQPVPYTGAWFQPLHNVPDNIVPLSGGGYHLSNARIAAWNHIEEQLVLIARALRNKNKFTCTYPFAPRNWKYDAVHHSEEKAVEHIKNGRDWFAMWIGLVYWMTRKTPQAASFVEGLTPPTWFIQLVQELPAQQATWDLVRTAPLLQRTWKWNRVGVWLHHPADVDDQPPAQWFVERGVPVWYRWGSREVRDSRHNLSFRLLAPSVEERQVASTFITRTPSVYIPTGISSFDISHDKFEHFGDDSRNQQPLEPLGPLPEQEDTFLNPLPCHADVLQDAAYPDPKKASLNPLSSHDDAPLHPVYPDPSSKDVNVRKAAIAVAKNIWDTFWEKRKATHERMLKDETPVMKHARECREQNKPQKSVKVYCWEWSFDTPPKFGKELVRKADREDVLDEHERSIKIYDSFFNEWHCTDKFEDDLVVDNVSEGSRFSTPAPSPPHTLLPLAPSNQAVSSLMPEFKLKHTRMEVVRILLQFFGFVPPLPLPSKFTGDTNGADKKSLIVVLGLDPATVSDEFFLSPLGMTCQSFLRTFSSKDPERKPPAELWDLAVDNRHTLAFSKRVSAIRTVKCSQNRTWYMFDFGDSRSVPWNLVVPSATAALYICRLSDNLQEDDVTVDLAQEGIRFHTVQCRDTLVKAPSDASSRDIISMRTSGHVFDKEDHDFYHRQCEYLTTLPRGHAALMRGGFARRIALEHIGAWDARGGPCGIHDESDHMFIVKDSNGVEYVDDNLTNDELDALCGLYITFTGQGEQTSKLSYYPLVSVFEGQGTDMGWWTNHAESLWQMATKAASNPAHVDKLVVPMNSIKWREKVRGFGDSRRALRKLESHSKKFLDEHVGQL